MAPPDRSSRDLDVVLFGATGYVGRLVADHLAAHAPPGARVALAGRSGDRLATVRAGLGPGASAWELVVADATDAAAMAGLAGRTRVVATTVGPYARYGVALAEACARAGTHYADLTGELPFVRQSIDRNHDAAVASGARVVHACGFDAVPSDLGVLLLAERARSDGAGTLGDTTLIARMRGGVSGGTIDSMRGVVDSARSGPEGRRLLADPYALSPDRSAEPVLAGERDAMWAVRDPTVGAWTAPFVMASFNTRIVRRSNALTGWSYGRSFRYREAMPAGPGLAGPLVGTAVGVAVGAFAAGMWLRPTRRLLDRVLPAPGTGPSEEARQRGWFRMEVTTTTSEGVRYRATVVAAAGDPGYAATAVMFGQSALCLAFDGDDLPDRAGDLTPATAMGGVLTDRLRAAGVRCEVEAL